MGNASRHLRVHGRRNGRRRRRERLHPMVVEVVVERMALGGDGVARVNDKVLFVAGGFPGDRARVEITRHAARFMRGRVVELLSPSPSRRPAPCPVADRCGGCPWMGLATKAQLEARQTIVEETLARIGHVDRDLVAPIMAAPDPLEYRNRLRMTAEGHRIGFRAAGSKRLVDVSRCAVARPELNRLLERVRAHLAPFLPLSRALQIEMALDGKGDLQLAVTGPDAGLFETFPHATLGPEALDAPSTFEGVANRVGDASSRPVDPLFFRQAGKPALRQSSPIKTPSFMGGQTLERSVRQDAPRVILYLDTDDPAAHPGPRLSFAQANPAQNARMVRLVHDLLGANPAHRILDLYAGDGNLTATLAPRVRAVVGADIDPVAIDRANTRTPLNARYLAGDVVRVLESLLADAQTFDGVVLDPPRAGAREACRRIADTGAARVVYVSCNPATLARDLDVLSGSGYRVVRVVPVDLFPQTAHVECVTLLERNVGSEGTESGQKLA